MKLRDIHVQGQPGKYKLVAQMLRGHDSVDLLQDQKDDQLVLCVLKAGLYVVKAGPFELSYIAQLAHDVAHGKLPKQPTTKTLMAITAGFFYLSCSHTAQFKTQPERKDDVQKTTLH